MNITIRHFGFGNPQEKQVSVKSGKMTKRRFLGALSRTFGKFPGSDIVEIGGSFRVLRADGSVWFEQVTEYEKHDCQNMMHREPPKMLNGA